ncbi:MAG: aldo/keto reductase [Lewinellaceae bacterium]|nr:aldo/keto reductase [Phaeodactylibacter sp.]MCB9038361.1 aldo/keto reductase [Lewinellaceae bacterium]
MKHLTIQNTPIPALGLGTYGIRGATAREIVRQALQEGYRHVDTAQFYANEEAVGQGIKKSGVNREEVFLVTKVWPSNLDKKRFLPSVEESLSKLQTEYADLLLIHWPHATLPLERYLGELAKAQEQGKARFIGVSNFNISQLKQTMGLGLPIITNQIEFHPLLDQSRLQQWMQEHDLSLTAYSPLAQGDVARHPLLQSIGGHYGKSAAQVALRWILQQDLAMAIPKTANPKRLKENMDVFDFELSEEEMARIDELGRKGGRQVSAFHGAEWD